ncbi:MAG: DUF4832 domain-containing protein [Polyangiaceae bacterium]|nr:DUF4832 domain-containing protein [Polyangiaceae bacterium]
MHRALFGVVALIGSAACGASSDDSGAGGAGAGAAAGGGGGAGTSGSGEGGGTVPGGPVVTREFSDSGEELLNPERGFYDGVALVGGGSFDHVRAAGRTLAYSGVHLDAYRDAPLDAAFLDELGAGFAKARQAGIKIVLRFVYNDGPYPVSDPDAPLARVLEHLQQLAPVLAANEDVIAVMQAGLIGAWGEWHSSTNGLDSPANKETILDALLDALPVSRMTQVRTPNAKSDIFGPALTAAQAFDGSKQARTGHHNDCFLASASDFGTYPSPIETWKQYVADDGRFTPIGGETCALNAPRTDCPEATQEMELLHWSFLNALYNQGVLDGWQAQGCLPEVKRRLGYRFALGSASYSQRVRPGGVLALDVSVTNTGYASPFNARPVFVVLDDGSTRHAARLASPDPRRWAAGASVTFSSRLRVPASLAEGTYTLGLWLPDDAASLQARADSAVRFANAGVWSDGVNVMADDLAIDAGAPGDADPGATEFVELP